MQQVQLPQGKSHAPTLFSDANNERNGWVGWKIDVTNKSFGCKFHRNRGTHTKNSDLEVYKELRFCDASSFNAKKGN